MNKLTTKLESYDSIQLDGTCNLETFHVWQCDGLHPLKNWSYAMAARWFVPHLKQKLDQKAALTTQCLNRFPK